jgi:hypothetical protein
MKMSCWALLIVAALLLAGCVETRFESPIGTQLRSCDARLKGLWTGSDPADRDAAIYMDDACHLFIVDRPATDKAVRKVELTAQYAAVDGKDYLVVDAASLQILTELKPPYAIDPAPAHSYFFARYHIDGKQLRIEQVDSEHVAQRVIAGKLQGTVSKTGGELHVFVRGDAARMLEFVRDSSNFKADPDLNLVRSALSLKQFEDALQRPAAKH